MPLVVAGTDSITLPVGTTAQRNSTPVTGMYRLNSTTGVTEYYNGTNWLTAAIVSGTVWTYSSAVSSVEFTNIPAGVKRVTVMFSGVSTGSTNPIQIQLGTGSTTYTISGYASNASAIQGTGAGSTSYTTGFGLEDSGSASLTRYGSFVLNNITGNTWIESGNMGVTGAAAARTSISGGGIALGAALTAVRIIASATGNPSDTFDAGSINILYE